MNEITTVERPETRKYEATDADMIRVLQNSLYPGAKPESVALVLSYCRMNGLDPMLKPVHIVPTSIKVSENPDKWERRDVLMPGISDYRIKAARSGQYGGKTEPEFGPDKETKLGHLKVRHPEWCKITVSRIVQGQARSFSATEYWLENYATVKRDSDVPNPMWRKRAYGQLAKCTEAQALRMAFPEFSGGQPTVEEMEGRDGFHGQTIDQEAPHEAIKPQRQIQGGLRDYVDSAEFDRKKAPADPPNETIEDTWIAGVERELDAAEDTPSKIDVVGNWAIKARTEDDLKGMSRSAAIRKLAEQPDNLMRIQAFLSAARKRLSTPTQTTGKGAQFDIYDLDGNHLEGPFLDAREFAQGFCAYMREVPAADWTETMEANKADLAKARKDKSAESILARLEAPNG